MAVKVVHFAVPLLKGNLRIDVRDSCWKDRQLYLGHVELLPYSAKKVLLCRSYQEHNRLISFPSYLCPPEGRIWSCESIDLQRTDRNLSDWAPFLNHLINKADPQRRMMLDRPV
jgi:hypothetical protein